MRAVIMAGGEGTRMRPFTNVVPKPLLPIGRKPVAQIIIERLRKCGIRDITMALEYGADLIRAYFQDGSQFDVNITYFQEPEKLGTAGSLARIPHLREGPFIVTNGDILTDLDYRQFLERHVASGYTLSIAAREEEIEIPYGVLKLNEEDVREVEEKPRLKYCFNAGIYALAPEALDYIPGEGRFDMTELVNALTRDGKKVKAEVLSGLWFDLAKVDDFEKALSRLEKLGDTLV